MTARALILSCVAVLVASVASAADLSSLMPGKVGDLERGELISGAEAQTEVDRLHGKALSAEASAIARYARPGERPAEVWVSRVADAREARRQTGLMVHKMYENPESPFRAPSRSDHAGHAVYRFLGMGMAHLIWYADDLVWWVSARPEDEAAFLEVFCR